MGGSISNYLTYPSIRKCSIVTKEKTYNWSDMTEYKVEAACDIHSTFSLVTFIFGKEEVQICKPSHAQNLLIIENWKNCGCYKTNKKELFDGNLFDVKKNEN